MARRMAHTARFDTSPGRPGRLERMTTMRERITDDQLLFDNAIVSHGFAPYMRDYFVVFDVVSTRPTRLGGSWIAGRYVYRFTHCPEAHVVTTVRDDTWQQSWNDELTDLSAF